MLLISIFLSIIDGIPPDGTPDKIIHTFNIGLVVTFDTLATLGIVFSCCCLLFNFIFKEKRFVCHNHNYTTQRLISVFSKVWGLLYAVVS